jgi:hypothetical protein
MTPPGGIPAGGQPIGGLPVGGQPEYGDNDPVFGIDDRYDLSTESATFLYATISATEQYSTAED